MSHWVEGRRDAEMNASNLELTLNHLSKSNEQPLLNCASSVCNSDANREIDRNETKSGKLWGRRY